MLKISDFGASKKISENSQVMSFTGTVAWMAPEVIRNEPCSEKIDIWSYAVVLWELLTCEVPYKDMNPNSILWGVGSNKLQLTIPSKAPDGIKLLLQQCWNYKPRNRPSFSQILKHLDVVVQKEVLLKNDMDYFQVQQEWKKEIIKKMQILQKENTDTQVLMHSEIDLIEKRNEELQHATELREFYEKRLEEANSFYFELTTFVLQLEAREQEIAKREKMYGIQPNSQFKTARSLIKQKTPHQLQTNESSEEEIIKKSPLVRESSFKCKKSSKDAECQTYFSPKFMKRRSKISKFDDESDNGEVEDTDEDKLFSINDEIQRKLHSRQSSTTNSDNDGSDESATSSRPDSKIDLNEIDLETNEDVHL